MSGDRPITTGTGVPGDGANYNLLTDGTNAAVYKPGQTTHLQAMIDGHMRTADIHIPSQWDGKSPLPTLYYFKALHPGSPEPESFTGLSKAADENNVAVVYLNGEGSMNSWTNGQRDFGAGVDENKYLNIVHNQLAQALPLDPDRQGLGGFSHGGSEAYALASVNDWVSSVQTDEGYMSGYESPLTRPISQQTIHALKDPIIPFGGTEQVGRIANQEAQYMLDAARAGADYIDIKGLFHAWEYSHEKNGNMIQSQQFIVDAYNRANGIIDPATGKAPAPVETKVGDITTRKWINPTTGVENRQVILGSGTHGWAGSSDHSGDVPLIGWPNEEISASQEMLQFLKDHPRYRS